MTFHMVRSHKDDKIDTRRKRKIGQKEKPAKATHRNLKDLDIDDEEFDEIDLVEARTFDRKY
jgi:hypothetical protein